MAGMQPGGEWGGAPSSRESNGLAVAALVLGIIAIVLFCFWYISMPCAILAIVFGALGRGKAARGAPGKGMATAGMVLGLIAIGFVVLLLAGCLALFGFGGEALTQAMEQAAREMQQMSTTTQAVIDANSP